MLYWGLSFQKQITMSNSLSSQESCTGKQVNEAQSINQLDQIKPDYNNSSQVSNINGNFPELDRIELMSEMDRLTKLEKIRKIASYLSLVLIILIPFVHPLLNPFPNQENQLENRVKLENRTVDPSPTKVIDQPDELNSFLSNNHNFIYHYLIVLLTISLSLMGSTYLIEFLVKLEINKISSKLKNTESIVKG
jgi:hypothetical protein